MVKQPLPTKINPGVQSLPDREGNTKTCISGQSYVCGKACLGMGSSVAPECNRGLNAANLEKANKLMSVLRQNKKKGGVKGKVNTNSGNPGVGSLPVAIPMVSYATAKRS